MPRTERNKTWYDGQMTFDKAAMLRILRQEGATVLDLARAFGVSLTRAQMIAKGAAWTGKQCRDCWRLIEITAGARADRCDRCREITCNHCGGPKPKERKSLRCGTCDQENFRGVVARAHHCRECGEGLPETRKSRLCVECMAADQRLRTQFRNNEGKRCRECGEPVPLTKGWTRNVCRACAEKRDALRRALSGRSCGLCGKERKDDSKAALCPDCRRDDDRIRRRGTTVKPEEHVRYREQQKGREEYRQHKEKAAAGVPPR